MCKGQRKYMDEMLVRGCIDYLTWDLTFGSLHLDGDQHCFPMFEASWGTVRFCVCKMKYCSDELSSPPPASR
ncbi:unnamed protein product [Soboliphyme baturini]|uniref:Uncharacterized protein n=1 Tax=Soboliphyme baturini TaxID=241478 RepID=A0A183IKE2_9BILA|nr:unnamed protein product [Soboliphyme baturini]